jgi:hypothetical protein
MEEAKVSVNFRIVNEAGLEEQWTLRDVDENVLIDRVRNFQAILNVAKPNKSAVETTTASVEPQLCPKCGNQLVQFIAKGQTHLKCSTSGWDKIKKQATGCDYVKWADRQATQGQATVIKKNWPELWIDGMTFDGARKIIEENKTW